MSFLDARIAWTKSASVEVRVAADIPVSVSGPFENWMLLTDAIYLGRVSHPSLDTHLLLSLAAVQSIRFVAGKDASGFGFAQNFGLPRPAHLTEQSLVDFLVDLELPIRVRVHTSLQGQLLGWLLDARAGLLIVGLQGQRSQIGLPVSQVSAIELLGLTQLVDNSNQMSPEPDLVGETSKPVD